MIVKQLYLVSHREGSYSPQSLRDYTNFVIGSQNAGKEPTDGYTLCIEEAEARQLAKKYECINRINATLLTMGQEQINTCMMSIGLIVS